MPKGIYNRLPRNGPMGTIIKKEKQPRRRNHAIEVTMPPSVTEHQVWRIVKMAEDMSWRFLKDRDYRRFRVVRTKHIAGERYIIYCHCDTLAQTDGYINKQLNKAIAHWRSEFPPVDF